MKAVAVFVLVALVWEPCLCRSVPDEPSESVVSIYTTQPTTTGTRSLDVYHQIASNIAERITSPIYRFLGIGKNKTEQSVTKKPWQNIELLDDILEDSTKAMQPIDNSISVERDREELSVQALTKEDKKPEKITLFSSYLPVINEKLEANDTINEIPNDDDEPFEFDDLDPKPRDEGGIIYFLELLGSFFQLVWGAISSIFTFNSSSNTPSDSS